MDSVVNGKGLVFDIQRFSVHDGPGIRTIVFLKGCPLSCWWCCNPESQEREPQIMYNPMKCIGCRRCAVACSKGALSFEPTFRVDYSRCSRCGKCVAACPSTALYMAGKYMTVEEVIEELQKDAIFYRRSGGGITLSGGEPLLQHDFARDLLKACKAKGWHTAMETTGYAAVSALEEVLPWLDLVLLDIKQIDEEKHRQYTGVSNQRILSNAEFICRSGVQVIVRVPVIPGFNDDEKDIESIAAFAKNLGSVREVDLLPYHRLGENKYTYLGYEYRMKGVEPPSKEKIDGLKKIIEAKGFFCKVGG